jgi:hypothetical protein
MLQHHDTRPITEAEREQALARLRDACVDGRLTLEEFSERAETALTARTQAQLATVIVDLTASVPQPAGRHDTEDRIIAILGDAKRKGRWRVGPQTTAIAVAGDCELDLRNAHISGEEVEIVAYAVMGDVKIIVPEGMDVELTGMAVMGDKQCNVTGIPVLPGSPLIRVRACVVMGDVKVRSK